MDIVEIDGRQIAFRRAGRGPSVLFLHGGWSGSREWRPQIEALSDEFDVIAWDAPGCGGSDDPPIDFGMAGYADAVAGLANALDLDRPHLVGLSFGGGLALAVYERHPDLAGSLVLASAYAGWAGSLPQDEITARVERMRREVELPRIQVPTLLLYGEADSRSPLPVAHALHAAIAQSELVVLPGGGHCTNLEAPEAFNTEVRRFLQTLP